MLLKLFLEPTKIVLSYFHFAYSLRRNIQEKGLTEVIKSHENSL